MNSSTLGRLNFTGNKLLMWNSVFHKMHGNMPSFSSSRYSGILISIEFVESTFSTNFVEFSYFSIKFVRENIPVEFGLPLVDEFTLNQEKPILTGSIQA